MTQDMLPKLQGLVDKHAASKPKGKAHTEEETV
jgi:hypothetical protein